MTQQNQDCRASATISDCGKYRYWLERKWGDGSPQVFVMLNPSTADATENDPTIRRCMTFAKREGRAGIIVVNLFALRATDPVELIRSDDPIGPENMTAIGEALLLSVAQRSPIICAWGGHRTASKQASRFRRRAKVFDANLVCFDKTKTGAPRHPLYLKADTPLVTYR